MSNTVHQTVLNAIRGRKTGGKFGYGVTTADKYVKSITGTDATSVKRFGKTDTSTLIKEAAEKLTFSQNDMTFSEKFASGNWKSELPGNVHDELLKLKDANILMVFKNVITSNKEDRDRDILLTDGAEVDPKMPFLWQHVHSLPLGKMLMVADHTKSLLSAWTVLFDLPGNEKLAQDAAMLIDNDALRISHGFIPKSIADRQWKKDDPDERMPGFEIKTFEIMEQSGVSVPSNTDAEIQNVVFSLYSGNKFASPYAKSWAKSFYDDRTLVVPGSAVETSNLVKGLELLGAGGTKAVDQVVVTPSPESESESESESDPATESDSKEYVRTNDAKTKTRKGVYMEMKGSFEWIRNKLRNQVKPKMASLITGEDYGVYIEATYSDHVVVELYDWDTSEKSFWKIEFTLDKDGLPQASGIPVELELSQTVQPKEKNMKCSPKHRVALKGLAAFLSGLKLTEDQKAELAIHTDGVDDLLVKNAHPTVFKQTEGGEEENPNSGDGGQNPGVESTSEDDGNDSPDGDNPDDETNASGGKSTELSDVMTYLTSESIGSEDRSKMLQLLATTK
jgi:hypothetical protein